MVVACALRVLRPAWKHRPAPMLPAVEEDANAEGAGLDPGRADAAGAAVHQKSFRRRRAGRARNPFSALWNVTHSTRPARTSVAAFVLAGCTTLEIWSSAPHAAHAGRNIDPHTLARAPRHQFRVGVRPRHFVEESEQLVRNEAAARGIDIVIALSILAVGEKRCGTTR